MRRTGRNLMHAPMGILQEGLPMAQLGKGSVFGSSDSNTLKAPESLTGCGPAKPKGLFTCTSALIMEVRPAIIVEFRS